MNRFVSILALLVILLSIASPILFAAPVEAKKVSWEAKFHPVFLEKIQGLSDDTVVEAVVRLKPLPDYLRTQVKGHYKLAVSTLKWWARITQAPVTKYIIENGGMVLNTFWLDNVIAVKAKLGLLKKLALKSDVVEIFENFRVSVPEPVVKKEVSGLQEYESWGIYKIRAPEAWDLGYTGEGVRICVIDTGVDITHPALAGKMLTLNPDDPHYPGGWMEFDEYGNPVLSTPHDTYGHGTHTSGTALGGDTENILIGVAPGATLMHVLALPGGGGTFEQVLAAMQWSVEPFYIDPDTGEIIPTDLPAHVVSMSWGATEYYGNELLPAIEAMLLANIIPVAAIGNSGPGTSCNPGNIWGTFGIGATDEYDDVASWSSGTEVDWPDPPEEWPFYDYYPSTYIKPDFSAPGVDILSSVPGGGYEEWSGTSMATPHVSGTVALIIQAAGWFYYEQPDEPETIYEILMATSVDFGDPGQDIRYGWGRIDAYEAVMEAMKYAKKTGVEGYVFDAETSEPIPWATVTVNETGWTVRVNASGYFKIPLDPGVYHLIFEAWAYETQVLEVQVVAGNGTIAGFVFDEITGLPIEGAGVTVEELGLTVYTNATGGFSVSVPAGTYTVTAWKEGYYEESQSVSVAENETVIVVFTLLPVGNGTIVGYVFDAETSEPIPWATVWTDTGIYNFTDETGFYMLNVPAGVYTVFAWALGYNMENVSDVEVGVGETVWVNFSLSPVPPTVVVIGNSYISDPHIAQIISEELGYPVVEYDDAESFLEDWGTGAVNPKVIIIDHWNNYGGTPDLEVVTTLLGTADALGVSVIILGTSWSSETGLDVLYTYSDELEFLGYPAPDDYYDSWPSPENVLVYMLDPAHPVFDNVIPDNDSWFYLVDINESDYADYRGYIFEDDEDLGFMALAFVNDTANYYYGGVGVGLWYSLLSNVPWFYLGSWAESSWMKYLEPGWDGMYSNNTKQVLVNAVEICYTFTPGATARLPPMLLLKDYVRGFSVERSVEAKGYTYVEVYMERLPYGWVTGHVEGSDGVVLAGAEITVLGTPVTEYADENGDFYFWLPAGEYTFVISAPGYADAVINVTIVENETTDLDTIILVRIPRVAIYLDYAGEIKSFVEYVGMYGVDYNNLTELTEDIATGFYDLVIWAGHYGVPLPPEDEFWAFIDTAESLQLGIMWLDNYGSHGYGINALHTFMDDPAERDYDWGAEAYVKVVAAHPIFRGYEVGDVIQITTQSWGDFSWFGGFSGETIGTLVIGGVEIGDMIAWKMTDAGAKWALLASMAPEEWTDMSYWTLDAYQIFYNAMFWTMTKPLYLVFENPYLHVGDTAVLHISGAPANTLITILLDGEYLTYTVSDEEGNATVEFTVPLIPGGEHIVEALTEDGVYYGSTSFYVLAKVVIEPTETTAPGLVHVTATGLTSYAPFYVYLDGNYLSFLRANESGAFETSINIPLVVSGVHTLKLIDVFTGEVLAEEELLLTQYLEQIGEISEDLSDLVEQLSEVTGVLVNVTDDIAEIVTDVGTILAKIDELNATLVGVIESKTGEIYALVDTTKGTVLAKLDDLEELGLDVKDLVEEVSGKADDLESKLDEMAPLLNNIYGILVNVSGDVAAIKTDMGTVLTKLDDIGSVVGVIESKTGEIYALVDTTKGTVLAKLDDLEALGLDINSTLLTKFSEVNSKLDDIESKLDEILDKLSNVNQSVASLSEERIPSIEKSADEAKSAASTASTVGFTASGLAVVALAASLLGFIRKK